MHSRRLLSLSLILAGLTMLDARAAQVASPSAAVDSRITVAIADSCNPPSVMIGNDSLTARIYLPHPTRGYYRGSRFDWSGLIGQLRYRGHSFFQHWDYAAHDPKNPEHAIGPADEFDITRPASYSAKPAASEFVKIGIGALAKQAGDTVYFFNKPYTVATPGAWDVELDAASVSFRQRLTHKATGVSYLYKKKIALDGATLSVQHTLENKGKDSLITSTYCHNFFVIDGDSAGPSVQVLFAIKPTPSEWQGKNIALFAKLDSTVLSYTKRIPGSGSLPLDFGPVPSNLAGPLATLKNKRTGVTVKLTTDPLPSRFAYWSKIPVCPEPFVDLRLAPGAGATWTNRYQFSVNK